MALLVYLPYAPPISWFVLARKANPIVLEQLEHYQKGTYRNRCHIAGPNGVQRLSIPLQKGKHQHTRIRDVHISYDQPWPHQHWQALQSAYGRSPFFLHYAPTLLPLYESPTVTLWQFNIALLKWVYEQLGWSADWQLSAAYCSWHNPVIDGREWVHPKQSLPAHLGWSPLTYWQVFQEKTGFLPDLSVFDLLFNGGPEAALHIEKAAAHMPDLSRPTAQ